MTRLDGLIGGETGFFFRRMGDDETTKTGRHGQTCLLNFYGGFILNDQFDLILFMQVFFS